MGFAADRYELTQAFVLPVDPSRELATVFGDTRALMNSTFGNYGIRKVDGSWRGYFGAVEYERSNMRGWIFRHGRPFLYAYDFATGDQ